jgi:hypothetical protein
MVSLRDSASVACYSSILSRFKLHLRPSHLPVIEGLDLPPLPPGKSVDDVFTDLLRFVKDQVQAYITARFAEGAQIWDVLSPSMDIVLTTPNGWELEQQQRMRASAQRAGWIPVDSGNRVRFVTEAEVSKEPVSPPRKTVTHRLRQAAVLYAIDTGNISDWIEVTSFRFKRYIVLIDGSGWVSNYPVRLWRSASANISACCVLTEC